LEHLRWEKSGRTLSGDLPNQYCYKSKIGQANVDIGGGEFAPYVWDNATKTLRFAKNKIVFASSGLEIYANNVKKSTIALHPEIDEIGWVRKTGVASGLTVVEKKGTEHTDTIEVSYDIVTDDNDSKVTIKAGGREKIDFSFNIKSKLPSTSNQRLTLETDDTKKNTEIKSNFETHKNVAEKTVGVNFGDHKIIWHYDEADDHEIDDLAIGKESKVRMASGTFSPGEEKVISPATWGENAISSNEYDCEQNMDSDAVDLNGPDTDGPRIGSNDTYDMGLIFDNVEISPDAECSGSGTMIEYDVHYEQSTGHDIAVYGIKGNVAAWTEDPDRGPKQEAANLTTANIAVAAVQAKTQNVQYSGAGFEAIIDEILSTASGWQSGYNMGFHFDGSDSAGGGSYIQIVDSDASPEVGYTEARLTIEYTAAAGGAENPWYAYAQQQ
jgi:hypothetical protein